MSRIQHLPNVRLLPLMVAAGAAMEDRGRRTFHEFMDGKAHSGFTFG